MKVHTFAFLVAIVVITVCALLAGDAKRDKNKRLETELSYVHGYQDGFQNAVNILTGVFKTPEEATAAFNASKSNWLSQAHQ